ncbi:diguanylate cyclase domain-containing protein [Lysobacter xanthus]
MAIEPPSPADLLDLMPDAVCVVHPDGTLLYASAAFERMLGHPRAALVGQRMFELVHPDDREATRAQAADLMDGRGERHFRNRYRHHDGSHVDLLWSAQWLPQFGVRVGVARDVRELRRVEQELEHRANHDVLTALPNRRRLHELLDAGLAAAERSGASLAVLYIDLDGFKAINDAFGHSAGDRVLAEAARRLGAGLREGDTVARVGGDEFVALLPGCDATGGRKVAAAICTQLARPLTIEGTTVMLRASIGAAIYPADARDADTLVAHADAAMFAMKRGRATPASIGAA